jgi:hypothetical protein
MADCNRRRGRLVLVRDRRATLGGGKRSSDAGDQISRDISATAARFISARTVADQRTVLASIEEKRADLATVLARIKSANGDSTALTTFVTLSQRLEANLPRWKRPSPND